MMMLFVGWLLAAAHPTKKELYEEMVSKTIGMGFDVDCAEQSCGKQLEACHDAVGTGGAECKRRYQCASNLVGEGKDLESCWEGLQWNQLQDDEVSVLDCATDNGCMPLGTRATSFIQTEMKRRNLETSAQKKEQSNTHGNRLAHAMASYAVTQRAMNHLHKRYIDAAGSVLDAAHTAVDVASHPDTDPTVGLTHLDTAAQKLQELQRGLQSQMMQLHQLSQSDTSHQDDSTDQGMKDDASTKALQGFLKSLAADEMEGEKTKVAFNLHLKPVTTPPLAGSLVEGAVETNPEDGFDEQSGLERLAARVPAGLTAAQEAEFHKSFERGMKDEQAKLTKHVAVDDHGNLRQDESDSS